MLVTDISSLYHSVFNPIKAKAHHQATSELLSANASKLNKSKCIVVWERVDTGAVSNW